MAHDVQIVVSGRDQGARKTFNEVGQAAKQASQEIQQLNKQQIQDNKVTNVNKYVEKQMQAITTQSKLLGPAFNANAEKARVLESAINKLTKAGIDPNNASIRKLSGDYNRLQKEIASTESASRRAAVAMGISKQAALGLGATAAAFVALSVAAVKAGGSMEQTRVAFTRMLGSSMQAQAFISQMQQFSTNTPFVFSQTIASAQQMMAFGYSAGEILPTLTAVGDAMSGLGKGSDALDRVTLAMGQIRSKGVLAAQEVNQLAENGIPAWKYVADYLGKTIPEVLDMTKNRAVDSGTAIKAIVAGMEADFGGMMAQQAQTIPGLWSNLVESAQIALGQLGIRITDALNLHEHLRNMGDALRKFKDELTNNGIQAAFEKLFGKPAVIAITAFAGAIMGLAIPALEAEFVQLVKNAALAAVAHWQYALVGVIIAGAAYLVIKYWGPVSAWFSDNMAKLGAAIIKVWLDIKKNWEIAVFAFTSIWSHVPGKIGKMFKEMADNAEREVKRINRQKIEIDTNLDTSLKNRNVVRKSVSAWQRRQDAYDEYYKTHNLNGTSKTQTAVQTSEDKQDPIGDALRELSTQLRVATSLAKLQGTAYDSNAAKASAYEAALKKLLEAGLTPSNKKVQELNAAMLNYQKAAEAASRQKALNDSLKEMNKALSEAARRAKALGVAFDFVGSKRDIYQSRLDELLKLSKPDQTQQREIADLSQRIMYLDAVAKATEQLTKAQEDYDNAQIVGLNESQKQAQTMRELANTLKNMKVPDDVKPYLSETVNSLMGKANLIEPLTEKDDIRKAIEDANTYVKSLTDKQITEWERQANELEAKAGTTVGAGFKAQIDPLVQKIRNAGLQSTIDDIVKKGNEDLKKYMTPAEMPDWEESARNLEQQAKDLRDKMPEFKADQSMLDYINQLDDLAAKLRNVGKAADNAKIGAEVTKILTGYAPAKMAASIGVQKRMALATGQSWGTTETLDAQASALSDALKTVLEKQLENGLPTAEFYRLGEAATDLENKLKSVSRAQAWNTLGQNARQAIFGDAPILNDSINGAIQGAQTGSPAGAIIGALLPIITSSETFGRIMAIINPILQAAADALGMVLEPLLPLLEITKAMTPIFDVLGQMLSNLLIPAMKALFPVIKFLGVKTMEIITGLGTVWNGILAGIQSAMNWLASISILGKKPFEGLASTAQKMEGAKIQLDELKTSTEELKNMTWDAATKMSELSDETERMIGNVPQGFKMALMAFSASSGYTPGTALPNRSMSTAATTRENVGNVEEKKQIHLHFGAIYGFDDFKRNFLPLIQQAIGGDISAVFGPVAE